MSGKYIYVGDADLNSAELFHTERTQVAAAGDVLAWVREEQRHKKSVPLTFTFIVDTGGLLWIADRQSEHVACARGGDVLSAGEMTFDAEDGRVVVSGVTNQSTGYCPEPSSWSAVEAALDAAQLSHPGRFTQEFIFRLCENCGQRNVVKEDDYTCAVCGSELPQEWNFQSRVEGTR